MKQTNGTRESRLEELLLSEKRRVWSEMRVVLLENIGNSLQDQYGNPQDIGDRGILSLLEETELSIVDIKKEQLLQLEAAITKLEIGRYGICEDCGANIKEERLRAAPFATCCVTCQQHREELSKYSD